MTAESWREVERHLLSVLTLDAGQREAYLERACGGDQALRRLLESLLTSEGEMGGFLETPPAAAPPGHDPADFPELEEGQCIGPYRVMRELGRGGMSVVFLAMREDLERRVAVKVIKRGMDSVEILRRFLDEQRILANLNHPSIAHLYDGGTTEDGLPYFVMEHVEGEPIDRFCDRRRLPVAGRLDLFRRVCSAVHYAHQNLVVHRDLKPGNILVTSDGVPKLLDFGIAKLLDPRLGSEELRPTAAWMRLMTPAYASPEQMSGEAITTASDVYSLGVLLYELLTGLLPRRIEPGLPQETGRAAGDVRPVKPSLAVARMAEGAGGAGARDPHERSQARATQPAKLARLLSGDLDNIVLMALRVEPQRRYSSVEQFSEDLRRSQAGLTVIAREDTFTYRAKTFLRRNKLPVLAALLVAGLIVGFAAMALVQAVRVDLERQQTEQVSEFLTSLFRDSTANSANPAAITAKELLDRGAKRVEDDLEEQPEVRATVMDTIGQAYSNMRFFDEAIPLFEEALHDWRQRLGEHDLQVAESLGNLAKAQLGAGQYEASKRTFEEALALRRRLDGGDSPEIAELLYELGRLRRQFGDFEGAEHRVRQAMEMRRGLLGEEHVKTAQSRVLLGLCLLDLGKPGKAEDLLRSAIPTLREALEEHEDVAPLELRLDLAKANDGLGSSLVYQGKLEYAEAPIHEALEMKAQLYGEDSPEYAKSLNGLAQLKMEQGDYGAVIPLLQQSIEVYRRRYGETHQEVVKEQYNLALSLLEMESYKDAEALFRKTLSVAVRLVDADHPRVAMLRLALGKALLRQGKLDDAEDLIREGIAALRRSVGEQHYFLALGRVLLGSLLADRADFDAAEELMRPSLPIVERTYGGEHWRTAEARSELAGCLIGKGDLDEAEALLRASYPVLVARRGRGAEVTRRARDHVLRLYQALGTPEQAVEILGEDVVRPRG